MYPAIRQGDIIEIVPVGTGALPVVGEVVALRRENDFVVHRFLGTFEKDGRRWLFTRGDSVLRADEPFPVEALAGRVVTISRGRRTWRNPLPRTNVLYRRNRLMVMMLQVVRRLLR
ncbi:MAG: S24/S26 family peptidase [Bacteroidales bacterium]|nr:S24/S26 family peptidase [Bacteroidales bacterium]